MSTKNVKVKTDLNKCEPGFGNRTPISKCKNGSAKSLSITRRKVSVENSSKEFSTPTSSKGIISTNSGRKSAGSVPRTNRPSSDRSLSGRKLSKSLLVSAVQNNASMSNGSSPFMKGNRSVKEILNEIKGKELSSLPSYFDNIGKKESFNISVGVRVRPFNQKELKNSNIENIVEMKGNDVIIHCANDSVYSFSYDHCFWSFDEQHKLFASQEQVYQSMARPLLSHAYKGYNVCLFAYGQTGSGKSYSIMGEDYSNCFADGILSENMGLIPRFCQELFNIAETMHSEVNEDNGCPVNVEISYIEIYKEKIFDLVKFDSPTNGDENTAFLNSLDDERDSLKIREHPQHGPYVDGASAHLVTSYEDLKSWINIGNKQRSVAATGMNEKSSRSHSVFTIKLTQTKTEYIETERIEHSRVSVINFVDLAGSERVAASYSEGARLKEGISINNSLFTLGKVISSLAEGGSGGNIFIPYRESKLTWLLKESLGGNSKTSMIATISPSNIHQEETLSTLRYAQQTRKIVNLNYINEDPTYALIRSLHSEVEKLRSEQLIPRSLFQDKDGINSKNDSGNLAENDVSIKEEKEPLQERETEILTLKKKLKMLKISYAKQAKAWNEKLKNAEKTKQEALEACKMRGLALKVESNRPVFVNLCEDSQLSQTLLYNLKVGATSFGADHSDVTLPHLNQEGVYCSILFEDGALCLYPNEGCDTFVNGKLVASKTQIFHNDRVILGGVYFFRVCFPDDSQIAGNVNKEKLDFFYAKEELLKEQKERIRAEFTQENEETKAQILKNLEEEKEQIWLHEKSLCERVEFLADELEEERVEHKESEAAKCLLEEQNKFLMEQLETMRCNKSRSSFSSLSSPTYSQDDSFINSIFKEVEEVLKEEMEESGKVLVEDSDLFWCLSKANNFCKYRKKPFKFSLAPFVADENPQNVKIIVHDIKHDVYSLISRSDFSNIVDVLESSSLENSDGEASDNITFETSLHWMRKEELFSSKLANFRDRVKDSFLQRNDNSFLNSSLNASILGISALCNASQIGGRRSSLAKTFQGIGDQSILLKKTSNAPSNLHFTAKMSIGVLRSRDTPLQQSSNMFIDASSLLIKIYISVKELSDSLLHTDEFNVQEENAALIAKLSHQVYLAEWLLMRFNSMPPVKEKSERIFAVRNKLVSKSSLIIDKFIRLLQGIESKVDSLIESESTSLRQVIIDCCQWIGFLNLSSGDKVPRVSTLASCPEVCKCFLDGVSDALNNQIEELVKLAKSASSLISSEEQLDKSNDELNIIKHAFSFSLSFSSFLEQFSTMKVDAEITTDMPFESMKTEAGRFLNRVGCSFDYFLCLSSALTVIVRQTMNIDSELHVNSFQDAIVNFQESLGELVDDVGIGSSYKNYNRCRTDSDSSTESNNQFLSDLHNSAMKVFRDIKQLDLCLNAVKQSHSTCGLSTSKLAFTVQHDLPPKSSFKNHSSRAEEKRVRFNVSFTSSIDTNSPAKEDDE